MILISNHKASEGRDPAKGSFNDISSLVAIPESVILAIYIPVVLPMGSEKVDPSLPQFFSGRVAVVRLVADQPFRPCPWSSRSSFGDSDLSKRLIKELDLSRRGRVGMASERNTLAIDQYHALCSLAPLGFPDSRAPFFAGKKLASTKTSSHSRMPSWSSSERKARHMSLSTSSSYHCLSLRQQVDGCGYRSGRSFHLAPVLRTQRIPSKTIRSSALGRPPFGLGPAFGMRGSIFFHCSSVNMTSRALIGSPPRGLLRELHEKYNPLFQARYRKVMPQ